MTVNLDGIDLMHAKERAEGVCAIPLKRFGQLYAYTLVDSEVYAKQCRPRRSWYFCEGYVRWNTRVGGTPVSYSLHRVVLGLGPDDPDVDHINGDPLDNRRANLRLATAALNNQNQRSRGGTSKYRGVYRAISGRWTAQVCFNYHEYNLGTYDLEDEAGEAAAKFRREHMPFSAEGDSRVLVAA